MAAKVDYARLREQTMGSGLDEEAVTVNTRALIDKVLARYSGEWTTLRELIQNAADAQAKKVTIRFETLPSPTVPVPSSADQSAHLKHVLLHHTLARLVVTNDGEAFGENDWSRLKRIAEGNPDETKIGAFGVGFYSVFADCENPFVSSGDQTMAFYWKGNSLFTRRGRLDQGSRETAFVLDYRNTSSPVPNLLSICQFLATSLTFVGLEHIELWLNQYNLITLTKTMAPSAAISIPSEINPKTKEGLMKIIGVDYQNAQIHAKWMNVVGWARVADQSLTGPQQNVDQAPPAAGLRSFFSRLTGATTVSSAASKRAAKAEEDVQRAISEDLSGTSEATVFLRISTVNVQTYCNKSLTAELERATKKPPPKHTRIAILTSSYDEAAQTTFSGTGSAKAGEIFSSVLPTKNGRIFIGFPTAQTTGLLAHISAPSVIPTVERESIDLNARYVRLWNIEMLRVAGIACRVAYNGDLVELKDRLHRHMTTAGRKKISKEDLALIMPAAVHALKQYTYQESTPSASVGQIIEEAFWTCNQKASITILSTRGVLPSSEVRIASEDLSFVDGIPVIPDEIIEKNSTFLNKLQEFGLLSEITTKDIKKELEAKALEETQLTELLKWAAKKLSSEGLDSSAIRSLFDGTVVSLDEKQAGTYPGPVLMLGAIDSFPNPTKVPAELPTSETTIPFRLVKGIPKNQLEAFGWSELQIVPWLRYLIEKDGKGLKPDQSITRSVPFAMQVLPVLSKSYDALSQSSKTTVVELLSTRTIIPTKLGLRTPGQAYLTSVKLFDDLPTIQGLQSVKEKFLVALGVRKTVELSVVFDRLMAKSTSEKGNAESKWSHVDLIKYLVSVQEDIPAEDITKLKKTPICPMEKLGETGKPSDGRLYKISELYEPNQGMRELQLPLLHWPEPLRKASPEARFLTKLGLKTHPDVIDMVTIMAKAATNGDAKMYDLAMKYYISNHYANGYRNYPMSTIPTPFLPIQDAPLSKLALPHECFSNKQASILGFSILRNDLRDHAQLFGVEADPPIAACADRLLRCPPKTKIDAKNIFSYFAGRLNEIGASGSLAEKLGQSNIVPTIKHGSGNGKSGGDDKVRLISPRSCFLGDSQTYGDIFDFVDFGEEANTFLLKIGSKHEPSAPELATMLAREPSRLLQALGHEKYMSLVRRIADNVAGLKSDKKLWIELQKSHCLLSIKEVSNISQAKEARLADGDDDEAVAIQDADDDTVIKEYHLTSAMNIVCVDDYNSFRVFRDKILYAPMEDVLEKFYASLGAVWLSAKVENKQSMDHVLNDQSAAKKLQSIINERIRLFLHDHSPEAVRHDSKWVEKHLQVMAAGSLKLRKSLKGTSFVHNERKTAVMHRPKPNELLLYITKEPDLYEVSKALLPTVLRRPKQQDYLAFEMIMESDLRRLKGKGYNVDRILRQKAAETRVAENERQKRFEEEQRRLAEEERALQSRQTQNMGLSKDVTQSPERPRPIPGGFEQSPEPVATQDKKKSGIFSWASNLKNTVGLNMVSDAQKHIKDLEKNAHDYYKDQQRFQEEDRKAAEAAGGRPPPWSPPEANTERSLAPSFQAGQPEQVTPQAVLNQNLRNAIHASRGYDSNTVFDKPTTREVKENTSYCDNTPATNLEFRATTGPGVKLFFNLDVPEAERSRLLSKELQSINTFAELLMDIANIYDLSPQSVHIYYDMRGSSIAFNKGGAIFANLRYFLQLHGSTVNEYAGKQQALTYWYITVAHEIAHNVEALHNAAHGYYTESLINQYYEKLFKKGMIVLQEAMGGDQPALTF